MTLKLMRETVAPQLAEVYPQFARASFRGRQRYSGKLKMPIDYNGLFVFSDCRRQPLWPCADLA